MTCVNAYILGYESKFYGLQGHAFSLHSNSMTALLSESSNEEMFRPPVNRAMRVLDRSFFQKNIPIIAAHVPDVKKIARLRSDLDPDVLKLERLQTVSVVKAIQGREGKALLLRPGVRKDGRPTDPL